MIIAWIPSILFVKEMCVNYPLKISTRPIETILGPLPKEQGGKEHLPLVRHLMGFQEWS